MTDIRAFNEETVAGSNTRQTVASNLDVAANAQAMREYFVSGATLDVEFRRQALMRMRGYLKEHEQEALDALHSDLGKAAFEAYATELGIVFEEISLCLKKLRSWTRPRRVTTSLVHFPSKSKVYASPYGVVLVLSPWNYPLQLALVPMIDAIAAGNCVALKSSRSSQATSAFMLKMLHELYDPAYICGFESAGDINERLLEERWDHICFTGSPSVARTIMGSAAKHLTALTLELGGKSPCIVDASANVKRAAQRIAWGKGVNSGQTCVAPDYLLVHESLVSQLCEQLQACFHSYYGDDILASPDWPHIVNKHHFERVLGLIDKRNPQATVAFGGGSDATSLKIEPTVMLGVNLDDPIMQEEIFGPVLPIMSFKTLDEAIAIVRHFEHPLAVYVFAQNKAVPKCIIRELQFGGATINDVVIHPANNHMGFGGVGNSGMGAYHGKVGFDTFTHYKSTLTKGTWLELPVRVPPFKDKLRLLRKLMR